MRYDTYDHSVTNVNDSFRVLGQALTTVVWRPAGGFAYVGSVDGSVWKFAEHTGFELLTTSVPAKSWTFHVIQAQRLFCGLKG